MFPRMNFRIPGAPNGYDAPEPRQELPAVRSSRTPRFAVPKLPDLYEFQKFRLVREVAGRMYFGAKLCKSAAALFAAGIRDF